MSVKLARLPADVQLNLISNMEQNSNAVITVINACYRDLDKVFYFGAPTVAAIPGYTGVMLNRTAYLYIRQVLAKLQSRVNELIKIYNDYNIVGPPDYLATPLIRLWQPQTLLFKSYQANINHDWQLIEDKLNGCQNYIKPYLKYMKGVS